MFTEHTTFRPRNGKSAEAYWRIRYWCEENGFSFSDVLNALMLPVAYYLENFCEVDRSKNKATVMLNVGPLEILHVFQGKMYPLASASTDATKDSLQLEDMQKRIEHWKARNAERPQQYDLILSKPEQPTNAQVHSKKRPNKRA
jgi:hypothetical protein